MERVYISSKQFKCPYQCIYCFNNIIDYKKGISSYKKEDIRIAAQKSDIIQPACDAELLLEKDWKNRLDELVVLNKNISFATKKVVTEKEVEFLAGVNSRLMRVGKILNVGVTVCRFNNYKELEPFAPAPQDRLHGLKLMYEAGIACNVIIRPLFPDSTIEDLKKIIDASRNYSYGYLLGPLYVNEAVIQYFQEKGFNNFEVEINSPEWNQGGELKVIHSKKLTEELANYINLVGQNVFNNNLECVNTIREHMFNNLYNK